MKGRTFKVARVLGLVMAGAGFAGQAQAATPGSCQTMFADILTSDEDRAYISANGTSMSLSWKTPAGVLVDPRYDYLSGSRIGVGDVRNFLLEYNDARTNASGSYQHVQISGNLPEHNSWSTESLLSLNLRTGSVWSRSLTWPGDAWTPWTNVRCYKTVAGNDSPQMVLTGHVRSPHGDVIVALRLAVVVSTLF